VCLCDAIGQIGEQRVGSKEEMILVEIGPRFVLFPIKILQGSFCGATLYENPSFVSPNQVACIHFKFELFSFADDFLKVC